MLIKLNRYRFMELEISLFANKWDNFFWIKLLINNHFRRGCQKLRGGTRAGLKDQQVTIDRNCRAGPYKGSLLTRMRIYWLCTDCLKE